ncbi:glycerol-3-phosphate acyltransferase [Caproiciproducens sp. LBM24188]|nr:glycerol-3-phosphate acyltransferase [Oscillospiraceae bacterium]HHV32421.1 glycerol-3-phosphate acyltransferase [Clostridiales bacterium]
MLLQTLVMTVIGFFCGSLMNSYYIPKLVKNVDVTKFVGSDGNPGSANAIQAAGAKIGFLCMALDVLKAFLPVFFSIHYVGISDLSLVPVMAAPVFGHAFSPFLKWNGGKAISTAFGSLLAAFPLSQFVLVLALILAFYKFVVVVSPDSTGVIVGFCTAVIAAVLFEPLFCIKLAVILISAVVIFKVLRNPNPGTRSIRFWRFSLSFETQGLRFRRI